ncbi:hypothetical protein K491DRAFT_552289, partial [Lophiostoma macrostomum CBS 122681]
MKRLAISGLLLVASSPCFSYPTLHKRANVSSSDIDILQFALAAEHLENAFYTQGLKNFTLQDFWNANFSEHLFNDVRNTAADEATHVQFLEKTIASFGARANLACSYDFPVNSVQDFITTARLLESLGVSAYLGQVANLQNPNLTTVAGTIVTVESRHATVYQKALQRTTGGPTNAAFDLPLGSVEVVSALQQFITSCPPGTDSKIVALPSLSLDTTPPTGSNFTTLAEST